MAAILGGEPDRIPWLIYPVTFARPFPADLDSIRNLPLWRELRPKGLDLSKSMPVYRTIRPHIKVKKIRRETFSLRCFRLLSVTLQCKIRRTRIFPEAQLLGEWSIK